MQKQLDSLNINYAQAIKKFEAELLRQENNITEPGEQEATSTLRNYFANIKNKDTAVHTIKKIKQQLVHIIYVNMNAIQKKKKDADDTADHAFAYEQLTAKSDLFAYLIRHESSTPFKMVVDNKENYYIWKVIEVKHGETNSKVIEVQQGRIWAESEVGKGCSFKFCLTRS